MHPVQPIPAHWPQRAEVQPPPEAVEVAAAELVVVAERVTVVLVVAAALVVEVVELLPEMPNQAMSFSPLMGMLWVIPAP